MGVPVACMSASRRLAALMATPKALVLVGSLVILGIQTIQAQPYPVRTVKVEVGYPPGGNVDTPIRVVANKLAGVLGANVIVENKPGAGGTIAAAYVAKSLPDGSTLLACSSASHSVAPVLYSKLAYDPRELVPVSMIGRGVNVLIVNTSVLPVSSMQEFIAYAKSNPGKVNVGSAGVGTSQHLAVALLASMTGLDLLNVPYKGGASAMTDLLGGQLPAMITGSPTALPHIRAGKVHAIAVTASARSRQLPDVPTIAESGVPGYDVSGWLGLCAPSGVPATSMKMLRDALHKVLGMPEVVSALRDHGYEISLMSGPELDAYVNKETARLAKLVKEVGIPTQ